MPGTILTMVLSRFSSGLLREMFAMKEILNDKEIHSRASPLCCEDCNDQWFNATAAFIGFGVGLPTLNKWVQEYQYDDLMSGPHEDVEKENILDQRKILHCHVNFTIDPATYYYS